MVERWGPQPRQEVERQAEEMKTHMDDDGRIWREQRRMRRELMESQQKCIQEEESCGVQQSRPQ